MYEDAGQVNYPLILVVDDDKLIRESLRDALEAANFRVVTAQDGFSAMDVFKGRQPDLVMLDLVMPQMDGFEICREIRSLEEGKYAPILIVTILDDTAVIHGAFEAGATDFISKPVNTELLLHRLQYMLRASGNVKRLAESEKRLARAQEIAKLVSWEWHPQTGIFWVSEEFHKIFGIPEKNQLLTLQNFLGFVAPADREAVELCLQKSILDRTACFLECQIRHDDGSLHLVRINGRLHATDADEPLLVIGTLQDITDLRQVEDRLKMLKAAVDCLPVGITFSDIAGKINYSNPAEAIMHGYTVDELIGVEARLFGTKEQSKPFLPEKFKDLGPWSRESVNVTKGREEFPVQLTSIPVHDSEGRYQGIVTICEDISDKKATELKIHQLAYYDLLTGLPNRGMFLDRLHQALARAHREERKAGLIFLDLDRFKDINDTLGHAGGDILLREVSVRIATCVRESDTLARLSGDEFVVVLSTIEDQEKAADIAKRIQDTLSHPFEIDGRLVYSSASIGIALYPDDGFDASGLFRCADTAMYHAKQEGRSCFRFFSEEMNKKITRRVALANSLRHGLEKKEFFLHYQPLWDMKTSRMVGVEVLLRWLSSDLGCVPPSEFIALTEDSGLIRTLGEWVLRNACIQACNWALAGHPEVKVAVNISGKQLKQTDFVEMLTAIIRETGVDPNILELEFTESVIMENSEQTIETLKALKIMGIQLSIDDFGTGYSSLNYLKHFPVDRIKIDRSFVADVSRSNNDASIVEAIIAMCQSLSLKVVAEGVENSDQLHSLSEMGCDEVQGFYLAMPMSAEDVAGILGGVHGKQPIKLQIPEWYDLRKASMEP